IRMFNLITHKINNERSDYLYTHFLLETNGSASSSLYIYTNIIIISQNFYSYSNQLSNI
ncbi:MAG: hypothetical protein PWP69_2104, partial [Enterococcus sp.]|nr:hypothetical protein [Enterococcus sp.]